MRSGRWHDLPGTGELDRIAVMACGLMYTVALEDWLQQQLPLALSDRVKKPLSAVITQLMREGVLDGTLPAGLRVPSSRTLAAGLGLARNTVVAIYEQLKAEGFLMAGQGSGTYVCRVTPDAVDRRQWTPERVPERSASTMRAAMPWRPLPLSERGAVYQAHPVHRYWKARPFRPGLMDHGLFPHALWTRIQQRHLRRLDPLDLEEGEPGGLMALRRAIADHIRAARGVRCQPSQVVITDGTSQSLDLIARLLCDPGDTVLLENPCYWAAAQMAHDHGLKVQHLNVDEQGLPVPEPGQFGAPPRLVCLTPSNQFPLGQVMPVARRLQWLDYAVANGTILVEDDYDSEYRFTGAPFPSLQGLDTSGQVIYLGTFSKPLYRGIRIAFVVVPLHLQEVFADANSDFYRDGDLLQQQVLADFIREGHFATHVRRTRIEYAARRKALEKALQHELGEAMASLRVRVSGGAAGVHLTLLLPDDVDDRALADQCEAAGVTVPPLSVYCIGQRFSGLVLSYAATPSELIAQLVPRIGPLLRAALQR